jgi:hypothetical protein
VAEKQSTHVGRILQRLFHLDIQYLDMSMLLVVKERLCLLACVRIMGGSPVARGRFKKCCRVHVLRSE